MSPLEIAADRLHSIEQLLLCPTPQSIREADGLLQQAAVFVSQHREALRSKPATQVETGMLDTFRVQCDRVAKLLEGARRAQWIRLRLIMSLTQTYTARAEAKIWSPQRGTVNVRM